MKTSRAKVNHKKPGGKQEMSFPAFCDFDCPHASFPPRDSVGACRREQAVYCTMFRQYNNKHTVCLAKKSH